MCVTLSFVGAAWAVPVSKTIAASKSMETIVSFVFFQRDSFELIVLFVVLFFSSIVRLSEIGRVLERLSSV